MGHSSSSRINSTKFLFPKLKNNKTTKKFLIHLILRTGFEQTHTKRIIDAVPLFLQVIFVLFAGGRKEILIFAINLVISNNHLFYKIYVLIPPNVIKGKC